MEGGGWLKGFESGARSRQGSMSRGLRILEG